ncbi:hypothetical protein AURDEDRAFT_110734 [Auricularia subglabra TFB-10046 SS5]|nr:hypothetical protein AURDEDRAFT_110734 [Auricularia subglabra TFB-10046 SS5]
MPFTDYVRNSLARPVLLEVLAFSLLAFSFSSRGNWNAFSLRLTLAHLHRFITAAPAGGQNQEAQVDELVQRLETLVRSAPEDDERRPHLERALDSLQSLHSHSHSRSPQPDGPGSPVNTHGACMSPRMLGLGPLLHSSSTPLSSPLRQPLSPMSPLALSLPALALDRAVPDPHPADVQQSHPHGLLLNLSDPALDDVQLPSNAVVEPDMRDPVPSTPVQQQAHAGLPPAEPHLDDPAFFFRALLLSPRHQRPAQPRTATTPTRRDERPVLPLLRERALSAPNIASLPALGLNLNLDAPPSPSMPLPAAPEPYSDDEGEGEAIFEQPAPIALAVDTLPSPSIGLPAAPASPFSDDERDVLAPLPSERPPLSPVDTTSPPPEAYEDLVSPITFAPAPLSPVREMSPVRFAPPSPTIAALPRAEERDWPAFPAVELQPDPEAPAAPVEDSPLEPAAEETVAVDETPEPIVLDEPTTSPIAVSSIPVPDDPVESPAPFEESATSAEDAALEATEESDEPAPPLLLTVHEPLEEDSDSEEGVTLDVVPVLPLQVEDTLTAAPAAESQPPAPKPESAQEGEEEEQRIDDDAESQGPPAETVVEIPFVIAPSPLLIPALLDEDAITPVSLTPEPAALLMSPKPDAVDVPLPPSRPSSALQQIEDDITRSRSLEEHDDEMTSQPTEEPEQDGYFDLSATASLTLDTGANGDESPVSTGASSPLTRDNLRQLNLSNGGPRASVSGGSLAWTAQSSAVDALEAALHKLRTMRSSGSLASRSGGTGSASPSPLRTQFQSGTSTPSPLRSHFAPALPPPIEDDVSPTFSQFSFTTESPTEDEHMEPEPASASDGLEGESTRDEALSVPLPKPKRKSSTTLLDVPPPSPVRRRASHLDVPATSTPARRASHLDFPRSAILQDDESVSGDEGDVAPLSLDQILDEVFPSASPEVHPVPNRTVERVPSFDFDFHRAGGEEEDRAQWRDSIRFPAGGESRDSLPGPSRGRTKSGKFVRRVLSRLHLQRDDREATARGKPFNASTVSLAPSTPPRSPASSTASSSAPRTHTRRSSKSSGKEAKTQRSRTVSLFSTLSSRRTAMTTPEPVPPVPQAGPSDSRRSRALSLIASGLGMPAREHGAVEVEAEKDGRRRSMSLFKRGGKKHREAEADAEVEVPPMPAMPPMPQSHSAPAGEMTLTPGKGKRRDRALSVFSTLSSRSLVGRYDNAAADEFGTLVGSSDGRPQKSRPGSSASSGKHAQQHQPDGTVSWAELIKPHPHPRARSSSPSSSRGRSMSPVRRPSGERRMSISNIAKHPPSYVEPHRPPLATLSSSVRRRTMSAGTVDARRTVSWAGAPRTPQNTHKRARTMSATGPPQAQPSPVQEERPQDLSPPALPVRPRPQRDRVLSNSFIQYLAHTKKRTHLTEEEGGSVRSAASAAGPVKEETVKARRERGRVRTRLVSLVSRVSKKGTQ